MTIDEYEERGGGRSRLRGGSKGWKARPVQLTTLVWEATTGHSQPGSKAKPSLGLDQKEERFERQSSLV